MTVPSLIILKLTVPEPFWFCADKNGITRHKSRKTESGFFQRIIQSGMISSGWLFNLLRY
jgi:MOSC domain-containing protein YiiM